MAHVSVTIAGRAYRMACADGEEPHLEELARQVDAKIAEMRAGFGEIGDQRLIVMAAVTIADELHEARRRFASQEQEIAALRKAAGEARARLDKRLTSLAEALEETSARIETVAGTLNGAG
ncbi:MAG: cell division protein ZapA [Rhodoblastus sp.]|nr:MAG: cell division protein ZapA [Rhodoblastus sp.]